MIQKNMFIETGFPEIFYYLFRQVKSSGKMLFLKAFKIVSAFYNLSSIAIDFDKMVVNLGLVKTAVETM